MAEYGEWNRKGATLSDVTAKRVGDKSLKRFKAKVRQMASRTRGKRIVTMVADLRQYLLGRQAYARIIQVPSMFKELDSWIRRKLRCYL